MIAQSHCQSRESGFTLMELLLAIGIFSVISVGAFRLIDDGLKNIKHADQRYENFSHISRCLSLFEQSLLQAVARPVREEYGDVREAFSGDSQSVEFTHFGWGNPISNWQGDLKRSRFEANLIQDEDGMRDVWELKQWQVLDRAYDSQADTIISCEFERVELRYAGKIDDWYNSWPVSDLDNSKSRMPVAVELTVDAPGFGEIQRFFTVGGQYRERKKEKLQARPSETKQKVEAKGIQRGRL
ncbi:type II secretion system minor pseudopilin GspJ [Pseudoteredinibacter isoporae]|uniref:Type II secretion system protein J n=1 Tax=Pseudoteredinibacter isoporae TaxID=570281 RepID=A0A7X0MVM3_9GAMM|nr:type II secretion system minor pseudopilin GspJ [Pseudoteredinibacter isoporae]MBB6521866.1 general secretion pathway protein J [Pseudoteredinibacter isoporae]NHO87410.1 type II secretion system minor pseudopilin GspJ [Pseudoteredinibacter isoporae]NIB24259.1 type II secretion system minor pseudopilin GspJ [Pseudoteredinibacter isoporae]